MKVLKKLKWNQKKVQKLAKIKSYAMVLRELMRLEPGNFECFSISLLYNQRWRQRYIGRLILLFYI